MAKRHVRITAVPRKTVDVDKLVAGLLLLLEELATESSTNSDNTRSIPEEPDG